ncbi:MAG: flagellar hook-associated protein FlgL, partial [Synergistaceae bacterium]|nr:flagellar hook-associated protein FlgL [Synergistaceae bacterium]
MYSRLTTATMYGSLMASLSQSQRNLQDLQTQIATGNKYGKLSDNPSAISRSLGIQSTINANDKYQTNTTNGITMLRYADAALNNVLDAVQSIRSLVIQAGDGALGGDQLKDITAQIEANKKIMLDNLNTKIAGQYIFGGTDSSTQPFVEMPDGSIQYQGTDERIKYAISESILGDVSFAGSDIVPENEDSYFICSHYVPLDWQWTGREEKVQITVGNRTLSVFIPETWSDSDYDKTNKYSDTTKLINYSDKNEFRDPDELSGISLQDLAEIVNGSLAEQGADMLVHAYIETDKQAGTQQLILKSNTGEKIGITGWPDTDYMPMEAEITTLDIDIDQVRPAAGETSILRLALGNSSPSTLSDDDIAAKTDDELLKDGIVRINSTDEIEDIADKINRVNGVFARTTSDGQRIVITAERTGDLPEDPLRIDEAQEALHYPALTIKAEGNAANMFTFTDSSNIITAKSETRKLDQSHMDVFDVLGMETAMKSREFGMNDTLTVETGNQLHWRVISGGHTTDIKLNAGEYTLSEIADRLKNAGAGWLEVTLSEDVKDNAEQGTLDNEEKTQRLVIRGYNGEQVIFLDMNGNKYADRLGLSTALRTDAYDDKKTSDTSDDYIGTGMKCVNFPSAPCVDDNVGIPMRVQMNCGMYYDVNIKKADVVDPDTGFVDRSLVMKSIVDQVNDIEGYNVMGFVRHVNSEGKEIEGSSSIYFLSGEAFTVVDMPFDDPEWNDYSGGLAAQMGIHGGVTSNLKQTDIPMTDSATFDEAYTDAGETFREG